jgi:hypothetical protein
MFPQWRGYEPLEKSSSQLSPSAYYFQEATSYAVHKLGSLPRNLTRLARRSPWSRQQYGNSLATCDSRGHYSSLPTSGRLRWLLRRFCVFAAVLPHVLFLILVFCAIFFPSYTRTPARYGVLRELSSNSSVPGRANLRSEKVFIAASIHDPDGGLTGGAWGQSVLDLVDLLGPENVFLSIYENDPSELAQASLETFRREAQCE